MHTQHAGEGFVTIAATVFIAVACTRQPEPQSSPASSRLPADGATPGLASVQPAAPAVVDRIDFKGWTIKVVSARTQREPLWINELTLSLGDAEPAAPAGRKVNPKGLLWLVTLSAERHGGEDIWDRSFALIDETGRRVAALAGGPGDGSFFMKGMGINKSGTYVLVFDLPADVKDPKLQPMKGSPMIDLPQQGPQQGQ